MREVWIRGAVAALLIAPPTGAARAQAWYLGAEGGWTHLNSATNNRSNGSAFDERFSDGFNVGGRAGYQWGPWRFEGEFSYRHDDEDSLLEVAPVVAPFPGAHGDRHSYAEMANLLYDLPVEWPVVPHVGGGVGAAEETQNVTTATGSTHSTDTVFAYQAIGGLEWGFYPGFVFDLDYRYFSTTDPHFKTNSGIGVRTRNDTHNLVASLIYRFGPPPVPVEAAPVPPVPPPVARRVFLVFFDWDRDALTPAGEAIIQEAAGAWRAGAPVQIMVTGYTDASGSTGYNQRLSERRANNVANALARAGVPRNEMVVAGHGKADQRVPTADGVREPQNRRVEIVFS